MDTTIGGTSGRKNLVPSGALLERWSHREWTDGVRIDRLLALDRLTIHTHNSTYEIIIAAPFSADVFVRGGAFFPDFVRARVAGSSLGGSFLKLRSIHVGFCMELADGKRTIITSPVNAVALDAGPDGPLRVM